MVSKYGRGGWFKESYRHYLASKGIITARYLARTKSKARKPTGLPYVPAPPQRIPGLKTAPVEERMKTYVARELPDAEKTAYFEADVEKKQLLRDLADPEFGKELQPKFDEVSRELRMAEDLGDEDKVNALRPVYEDLKRQLSTSLMKRRANELQKQQNELLGIHTVRTPAGMYDIESMGKVIATAPLSAEEKRLKLTGDKKEQYRKQLFEELKLAAEARNERIEDLWERYMLGVRGESGALPSAESKRVEDAPGVEEGELFETYGFPPRPLAALPVRTTSLSPADVARGSSMGREPEETRVQFEQIFSSDPAVEEIGEEIAEKFMPYSPVVAKVGSSIPARTGFGEKKIGGLTVEEHLKRDDAEALAVASQRAPWKLRYHYPEDPFEKYMQSDRFGGREASERFAKAVEARKDSVMAAYNKLRQKRMKKLAKEIRESGGTIPWEQFEKEFGQMPPPEYMARKHRFSVGERIFGMGIIGTSRRVDAVLGSNLGGFRMSSGRRI